MIPNHVFERVFRIFHEGRTVTGYVLDIERSQYFVSAAHVFEGALSIKELSIFHGSKWKTMPVEVVFNSHEIGDTIVFRLAHKIINSRPIDFSSNFVLGAWAYFLGFPLSFGSECSKINNDYPIPFIKGGLISNFYTSKEGLVEIYLDGHNNKGFSGGPVVFENPKKKLDFRIIGTVSGYYTESTIHNETKDEMKDYQTNAGIVEAFFIKGILGQLNA